MQTKWQWILFNLALLSISLLSENANGQTNANVSPKLDFDDKENKNNTNVPIVPGNRNAHGNRGNHGEYDDDDGDDDDAALADDRHGGGKTNTNTRGGSGGKTGPKIHGVRVTVDTGDGKNTKESKESVEITDLGKHKKRVGIHTDITFEITANGEDANATSSGQRHSKSSDEDASVPIFKGRSGAPRNKARKPYDPKSRWNTNFSQERRGYDAGGRNYPNYGGYYPDYPHNVPVYGDAGQSDGYAPSGSGTVYRTRDGWTSFVPTSWTTERTVANYHQTNTLANGQRTPSWKPCYCLSSGNDYRKRRASHARDKVQTPTSSVLHVVDSKLEQPFSSK